MLKKLRNKKTTKRIWIILTILIVPAFTFWGFGSFMRDKEEEGYAGRIFGKKVSALEYKDALEAVKNQAIVQFGDNFEEIRKNLNLESMAWERLLLLAEAKKRKININDREVIELIQSYPFFQRKGKFDSQIYAQMLQYVFHTQPRIFEEHTRQSLALSKLYRKITDTLNLNEEEIKKEYQKLNEQIDLQYIASLPSDFTKDIAATDEETRGYFAKNSFQFKQPVSFNVEYISIAQDDKNGEALKDKVKKISLRLNNKEGLAKVAKEFDLEAKETGLFSQTEPIPGIGWSPQILSLISELKTGEFSLPAYIDNRYYVFRLKERKESYTPDFQEIKDKVKEAFIKERARGIARQKIEECRKDLDSMRKVNPKSIDFDKAAKVYGLKSDSTGLFHYGSYITNIGASDNFFTVAQNLKDDDFSEIIDMPTGFYIIKVKSKAPVDEKKFLDEKAEFSKRLLLDKRQEYFSKFFEDLKRNAQQFRN